MVFVVIQQTLDLPGFAGGIGRVQVVRRVVGQPDAQHDGHRVSTGVVQQRAGIVRAPGAD